MSKKRKFQLLFSISILAIFTVLYCNRSYFGFNQNSLQIKVGGNLDLNKIHIYKGFYPSFHYKSEIGKAIKNKDLIFEGKTIKNFETIYGENDFIISYDKKYAIIIRYFKTNNRQCDLFELEFIKSTDGIKCNIEIKGTDNYKGSSALISIG